MDIVDIMRLELDHWKESFGGDLKESHLKVIDYFLKNNNKPTYPKKISEDVELSEHWVGKRCQELFARKIFKIKMKKIKDKRRPGKDRHYFISRESQVYTKILCKYLSDPDWDKRLLFMDSSYTQSELNMHGTVHNYYFLFVYFMSFRDPEIIKWNKKNMSTAQNKKFFRVEQLVIYLDILRVSPSAFYYVYIYKLFNMPEGNLWGDLDDLYIDRPLKNISNKIPIKDDIIIYPNQPKEIQSFHSYLFKLLVSCMFSDILRYPKLLNTMNRKNIVNNLLKEFSEGVISKKRCFTVEGETGFRLS